MKRSYMDYAMSLCLTTSAARCPHHEMALSRRTVRPVRRMKTMGLSSTRWGKCACRFVRRGDGELPSRMADLNLRQRGYFYMRYPLVMMGNFGSVVWRSRLPRCVHGSAAPGSGRIT